MLIVKEFYNQSDSDWLRTCMLVAKDSPEISLGELCDRAGLNYRSLYKVLKGERSIRQSTLDSLKREATMAGLQPEIERRLLQQSLGLTLKK